jgi:dihydrofolate reductase
MSRIIINEHITLDNVIQSPGEKNEDTTGNFKYGGWIAKYSDTEVDSFIKKRMDMDSDFLLGRKTFELWENYWPNNYKVWPQINNAKKYVVSSNRYDSKWQNSVFIGKNIILTIKELKKSNKKDLVVWGSSVLVEELINNGLVDELNLIRYPILLGCGKKIFSSKNTKFIFKPLNNIMTKSGTICTTYSLVLE